jgi:zinc protease
MSWSASTVRAVLPNGLTLLAQRVSSAPVVAVVTYVRAGYFDEPDEWVGIAHVLEHMFFKGTPTRDAGALARETQRLGGYLNAATGYDRTVYYTVLPSTGDGLARALALQADALRHAALDPGELARELEVVIQEAKRKLDTPSAVTAETLYQLLFRVHRMRRWRIGTEAGLRTLDAAALRAYYETRYVPDRVIVALTGDLDPDRAVGLARDVYGDWTRAGSTVAGSPPEPERRESRLRTLRADVERPHAAIGWRTAEARHPDAPALDLASVVLGAGRASWLGREVRLPGLAATAGASHFTPGDVGVFEVTLSGAADSLAAAVARSVALAERLADTGPDAGQLERARALIASHWARRFESADARASTLAQFEALGGVGLVDEYVEHLLTADAARVRDVAGRYLTRDTACAVVCARDGVATGLSEDDWPLVETEREPPAPVPVLARSAERVTAVSGRLVADDVVHCDLGGADLLARRHAGAGLVTVGIYLPGVTDGETVETAGLSRLLARVALRGAGHLSAEALALEAERLGGSIAVAADADLIGWSLTVPVGAALAAARLLRLVAGAPRLEAEHVAMEGALLAADAAGARDDMYRHPLQRVLGCAFPEDAYGLPPLGDPARVPTFDAEILRGWHARALRSRAVVVVVGDDEPERLAGAASVFREWTGAAVTAPAPAPAWRSAAEAETRVKAQTALALAFPAPAAGADARYALAVTGTLLSGLAGRLFEELRERRALAYTVQAAPWLCRRAGAVLAYVATSPDRETEARDALLAELARLAAETAGDDEVERARRYAAGLVVIRRQRGAAVAGELVDAWVQGTIAGFPEEESRRRAVTAADVLDAARLVFRPEGRAEYVVRGTAAGAATADTR